MKPSFLKNAVACSLLERRKSKLMSKSCRQAHLTTKSVRRLKIATKNTKKQPVCSLCLVALATPDLWAYFVYHAAIFLLYPKRPKT